MVLRLVLDAVRRKWMAIAFAVFQIYLICKVPWTFWPTSDSLAWLLAAAAFLTTAPGAMLQSRELYQLPVSRRVFWRARWWLSTAGAALVAQLGVSLAEWSARSQWPSGERLVLSTTFAFLYCGCTMALVATQWGRWGDKPIVFQETPTPGTPRTPPRSVNMTWLIVRALLRVVPGVIALLAIPLAAPFVFARYLPHTFSAFHLSSAIVMLAMAAVSVWSYAYQPAIEARPSSRAVRSDATRLSRSRTMPPQTVVTGRARFVDRLTGIRLPLWTVSRKYLITYSSVIAAGIAWWWVTSFYKVVPALSTVLGRADMLPFASRSAHVTEPITVGALFLIGSLLDMGTVTNFRPLRTLPLSATQLGAVPVCLGLISATMLWIVFAALHGLVLRTLPVSFRPDLFIAFAALTALTQACGAMLPGPAASKSLVALAPIGIIWLALGYTDSFRTDIVQPAMFVGGLLTLAAAFVLMRRAVTHGRGIYQPRASAVRF
jgi:hypothetical protein